MYLQTGYLYSFCQFRLTVFSCFRQINREMLVDRQLSPSTPSGKISVAYFDTHTHTHQFVRVYIGVGEPAAGLQAVRGLLDLVM